MNSKPIIRNATKEDIDGILEVEHSAFPPHLQAETKTFLKRLEMFSQGFFVLMINNEIIGISSSLVINHPTTVEELEPSDEKLFNKNGDTYYLRSLAIKKEFQKMGYGKLLINKQLETAKKLDKKHLIFTCVKHLEKYYKSLGCTKKTDYKMLHDSAEEALWEYNS